MDVREPIVGVDLGGTNMQVGLVSAEGEVVEQVKRKTRAEDGAEAVLDRIAEAVRAACEQGGVEPASLRGVGLAAAGACDADQGVIHNSPNLGWRNLPVAEALQSRLNLPVALENDVNAALYGENERGAGGQAREALGVWVGTGVGGGLILNGDVYYGAGRTAGEIGHMILMPGAPLAARTIEDLCSRTSVVTRLRRLVEAGHESSVLEHGKKGVIRSKAIASACEAGDRLTREVVDEAADLLGVGVAGVVTLLSLQVVVLGGGLTEAVGRPFVDRVAKSIREHVFPDQLQDVRVVETQLRDKAGIIGAALLARRRFGAS